MSLEFLEKYAEEKFASEEERAAFKDAFVKKASLNGTIGQIFETGAKSSPFVEGAGKALGALAIGVIGAGLAKGLLSGSSAASSIAQKTKFEKALQSVKQTNIVVKSADPGKVDAFARTIFSFAPNIAGDPNLLATVLANAIHGESIDPQSIKLLVELEGRFKDNQRPNNFVSF